MKTKDKAIEHYERMIEWAKTQDGDKEPRPHKMLKAINETYTEKDCAYCISADEWCCRCKLNENDHCCNGIWDTMFDSTTWSEWITNANAVLKYIRENG